MLAWVIGYVSGDKNHLHGQIDSLRGQKSKGYWYLHMGQQEWQRRCTEEKKEKKTEGEHFANFLSISVTIIIHVHMSYFPMQPIVPFAPENKKTWIFQRLTF